VTGRLSLSEGQRAALARMGVVADGDGVLRAAGGQAVNDGVAASMLKASYATADDMGMPAPARITGPSDFQRPYLTQDHQTERPAGTPVIPQSHPVSAGQFARGYIADGHAAEPPGNDPEGNPAGATAAAIYSDAMANRAAACAADHAVRLAADTAPRPQSMPQPSRHVMRSDLDVAAISAPGTAGMTRLAPGEVSGG